MPQVQDRSLELLTCSPARYHWTADAPIFIGIGSWASACGDFIVVSRIGYLMDGSQILIFPLCLHHDCLWELGKEREREREREREASTARCAWLTGDRDNCSCIGAVLHGGTYKTLGITVLSWCRNLCILGFCMPCLWINALVEINLWNILFGCVWQMDVEWLVF